MCFSLSGDQNVSVFQVHVAIVHVFSFTNMLWISYSWNGSCYDWFKLNIFEQAGVAALLKLSILLWAMVRTFIVQCIVLLWLFVSSSLWCLLAVSVEILTHHPLAWNHLAFLSSSPWKLGNTSGCTAAWWPTLQALFRSRMPTLQSSNLAMWKLSSHLSLIICQENSTLFLCML